MILSACVFGDFLQGQQSLWFVMHVRHFLFDVFVLIFFAVAGVMYSCCGYMCTYNA